MPKFSPQITIQKMSVSKANLGGWVSKNRRILPAKWMVYFMENPMKMDDLGVPLFLETPIYISEESFDMKYWKGWS